MNNKLLIFRYQMGLEHCLRWLSWFCMPPITSRLRGR